LTINDIGDMLIFIHAEVNNHVIFHASPPYVLAIISYDEVVIGIIAFGYACDV
jgi:hypothetical protein